VSEHFQDTTPGDWKFLEPCFKKIAPFKRGQTDIVIDGSIVPRPRQKPSGMFKKNTVKEENVITKLKRVFKAIPLLSMVALATPALAQDYPTRPITLIVPYAAGGPTDIVARIIAPGLTEALGQEVIVDNRGGAGTTVGTGAVVRAEPDGYTLLLGDSTLAVTSSLFRKLPYDSQKDLTPINFLVKSQLVLVITPSHPAKDLEGFLTEAKQNPDAIKYGSAGIGSPPHLAMLALQRTTGSSLTHVPYRGSGPASTDVMAGHIATMFLGPSASASLVQAGSLRALAVTGSSRSPSLPDVPTFTEKGIELGGANVGTWWGILGPKGMPPELLAKINAAANKALNSPNIRQKFEALGFDAVGGRPEEFGELIASQETLWRKELATAGVKAE
jgi:tripartite-type tricarboxylate transporter receptor subunit TctC